MARGLKRDVCLQICGLTKNQFYHKLLGKKRGRKKTRHTLQLVDNEKIKRLNKLVIEDIKKILKDPDADYGYHKITSDLQILGWFINHKKVYRLMKSHQLLRPKPEREAKNYVKYRILAPKAPLRLLIDEKKRKVRFKLNIGRQYLRKFEPAGKESQREVLSVRQRYYESNTISSFYIHHL